MKVKFVILFAALALILEGCNTTEPPEAQAEAPGIITLDAACDGADGPLTLPIASGTLADGSLYEIYRPGDARVLLPRRFRGDATTENIIFADQQALVEGQFVGRHVGEFAGIPATGKAVRVPLCVVYALEEDCIKRGRIYFELPILMQQLGVAPA